MSADLRRLRRHLGLTQEALAGVLGISRKQVNLYERGNAAVPRHIMLAVLGLCLWHLINEEQREQQ